MKWLRSLPITVALLLATSLESHAQTVHVRDKDGKPVAGAIVSFATPGSKAVEGTSDANGTFVPPPLPRQYLQIMVYAPGHALWARMLLLAPPLIEARLKTGITVRGTVQQKNVSVAGTTVAVRDIAPSEDETDSDSQFFAMPQRVDEHPRIAAFFRATTDASGRWTINDLPRDTTTVALADARYAALAVTSVGTEEAPPLEARAAGLVTGRVTGENGAIAGVTVRASMHTEMRVLTFKGLTAADGRFTIAGLPAGSYTLSVEPTATGTAAARDKVVVREGETTTSEFRWQRGALLQVEARDVAGAPLSGVLVSPYIEGSQPLEHMTQLTDARGRYQTRVAPGEISLRMEPPFGYLPVSDDDTPEADEEIELTLADGETETLTPKWKRAASVAGIAVDEKGVPLRNVRIRLGEWYQRQNAVTDEMGRFVIEGVAPQTWKLSASAPESAWDIVSPKTLRVGEKNLENERWVFRRAPVVSLQGRVVDAGGAPVEDAQVEIAIRMSQYDMPRMRRLATDAQGRYEMKGLRPDWTAEIKSVVKTGYSLVLAGAVARRASVLGVSGNAVPDVTTPFLGADSVVVRGSARTGRVVDAAGKPVANAEILSAQGEGRNVVSNEQGQFALPALPQGEVHVFAAHGTAWGKVQSISTVLPDIAVRAQTPQPLEAQSAHALLKELWQTAGRTANSVPATLSRLDPEAALRLLATAPDEKTLVAARTNLTQQLAEYQPAFLQAHPELLDSMPEKPLEVQLLALALARNAPDMARAFTARLAAQPVLDSNRALLLAALAARLQLPDAASRADAAIATLKPSDKDVRSWTERIGIAASGSASLARRVLDVGPPEARTAMLGTAAGVLAKTDLPAALQLLDALKTQPPAQDKDAAWTENNPDYAFASAAQQAIHVLARGSKEDREAAYALAQRVHGRSSSGQSVQAMAAAGIESLDPARALATWIKVAGPAPDVFFSRERMRLAALIRSRDEAAGKPFFISERTTLDVPPKEFMPQTRDESRGVNAERAAMWAFYAAPYEPAAARIWLEREWLRLAPEAAETAPLTEQKDSWDLPLPRARAAVVRAMVALDGKRAVEMAQTLPEGSWRLRSRTLRNIALWSLMPQGTRSTVSFSDQLFNDSWLDGDFGW
ncbi:MAG TPA: carboxypeptidase-like regulatory domain-containing protein [Abditibacteriaceae bacterium]|jgi:hypothetical protein